MNIRNLTLVSLALVMSGATVQTALADSAEQAVMAAENQWLKSQQTNNVELLAPLLADKVVETVPSGKVFAGKDAVLADAKSEIWSSVAYTDVKVTVFGETAIATGTVIGKGKDATTGAALDERIRFTDTWVKTNGKWLCVASADSAIKK